MKLKPAAHFQIIHPELFSCSSFVCVAILHVSCLGVVCWGAHQHCAARSICRFDCKFDFLLLGPARNQRPARGALWRPWQQTTSRPSLLCLLWPAAGHAREWEVEVQEEKVWRERKDRRGGEVALPRQQINFPGRARRSKTRCEDGEAAWKEDRRGLMKKHKMEKLVKSAFTVCVCACTCVREPWDRLQLPVTATHSSFVPNNFSLLHHVVQSQKLLCGMSDPFHFDCRKNENCSLVTRRSRTRPFLVVAVSQTAALIHAVIYSWRHFGKTWCLYVAVSSLSTVCEEKTRVITVFDGSVCGGQSWLDVGRFLWWISCVVCGVTSHCSSRANSTVYLHWGYLYLE